MKPPDSRKQQLGSTRRFPPTGKFLAFEGPEGSGKSTQIRRLADALQERGREVVLTREPGGTPFGEVLRQLLLDHKSGNLQPATELALMLAQRSEHLARVIVPGLERGAVVITDRYLDSSLAYQGYGRGFDPALIRRTHLDLLGPCLPDLTILFDIDPRLGLERARHGGKRVHDRLEAEAVAFHERVRAGYLELATKETDRFLLLSADGTPDEVWNRLESGMKERLAILWK